MDESHRYRASAGFKAINDLKPVLGLEEECKKIVLERGDSLKSFCKNYIEQVLDSYEDFYVYKESLYEIIEQHNYDYDDIFEAILNGDGTINFILNYNNGGCCFNEALDYAMKKLE
jgi:type III restriction enzyme